MKDWALLVVLNKMIEGVHPSTKERLLKSFIYTIGVMIGIIIAVGIFMLSPTAFFVSLVFLIIWGWIFANLKKGNY